MSTVNTSASAYFPRPELSGTIAQFCMLAGAAGMTAMIWASALGSADQPTAYIAAASSGNSARIVRVSLPPVQIVARRDALADVNEVAGNGTMASAGCAADRNAAHKPG